MRRLTTRVSISATSCLMSQCLHVLPQAGAKTGPISGPPPELSSESMNALLGAQKDDPLAQHEGGLDGGDKEADTKVRSEKECTDPA